MAPKLPLQNVSLGRLQAVDLRSAWVSEAGSFTPWLAEPDNLTLLAETLGLNLEVEVTEKPVGPFRADILCKDLDTGSWVLIENQIERTDHIHLGQLLTYAAGLQAAIIIWISARFTDEHRAALDWLNAITQEEFAFFGVEVELWRIGNSSPAPRFHIVSKPNSWSRAVGKTAQRAARSEPEGIDINRVAYWTAFADLLAAGSGPLRPRREPPRSGFYSFTIDAKKKCYLYAYRLVDKKRIGAYLAIYGSYSRPFFDELIALREEIERVVGEALFWEEVQPSHKYYIGLSLDNADALDETDWPRQHRWLVDRLNRLYEALVPVISRMDQHASTTVNDTGPS
jgi:hypothetical protein